MITLRSSLSTLCEKWPKTKFDKNSNFYICDILIEKKSMKKIMSEIYFVAQNQYEDLTDTGLALEKNKVHCNNIASMQTH